MSSRRRMGDNNNLVFLLGSILLAMVYQANIFTTAQELSMELVNTRLPQPLNSMPVIFDGIDSIFILAGQTHAESSNIIYSYNTTSDTLEEVGSLPEKVSGGSAVTDRHGNIFHFGGGAYGGPADFDDIYKYDPNIQMTSFVKRLNTVIEFATIAKHNSTSDIAYLIGGRRDHGYSSSKDIIKFNLTSTAFETAPGSLQNEYWSASSFVYGDSAFIFGQYVPETGRSAVEKLNLTSGYWIESEVGPSNLPSFTDQSAVVTDGRYGYVIGGWRLESGVPEFPADGIIRFDPETFDSQFIQVANYSTVFSYSTRSAIYVPNTNRIYIFGGYADRYRDEIWYIDLSPLDGITTSSAITTEEVKTTDTSSTEEATTTTETPTTVEDTTITEPTTTEVMVWPTTPRPDMFSCTDRPDDIYPHPSECSKFIICFDEEVTIYDCPIPYLYDPETKSCHDQTTCYLTCADKPTGNGKYPHPYYCTFYLLCADGQLDGVEECPPLLHFSARLFNCIPPALADCHETF